MTRTEFENLIGAYGADPDRWPENRRAEGEQYAATHVDARALLQAEAKLDSALDLVPAYEPSEILKARIMKAATGRATPVPAEKSGRIRYWKIAASFAAIMAAGVIGYSAYSPAPQTSVEDTVWLEAANELGVSDIYAWVEGTE